MLIIIIMIIIIIIIIKGALVLNTDTVPYWSERYIDFFVQYLFRERYGRGNGHSGKCLVDEMII